MFVSCLERNKNRMTQLLIKKSIEENQELNDNNKVVTKKVVNLEGSVIDEQTGNTLMKMRTSLLGDGSTPKTIVFGGSDNIIGYNDDGSPRLSAVTLEERDKNLVKFRARAIKEQKELSKENGIDPSVVNNYGDELK